MKKFLLLALLASVFVYFSPNASAAGHRNHRYVHHKHHHRHHQRHHRK